MAAAGQRWWAATACAAAGALAATLSAAQPRSEAPPAGACVMPQADATAHPLARRDEILARYRQLPEPCLKAVVVACNAAASQSLLDLGSAVQCSIGYEALLAQGFRGDFHALMAWWRSEGRLQH